MPLSTGMLLENGALLDRVLATTPVARRGTSPTKGNSPLCKAPSRRIDTFHPSTYHDVIRCYSRAMTPSAKFPRMRRRLSKKIPWLVPLALLDCCFATQGVGPHTCNRRQVGRRGALRSPTPTRALGCNAPAWAMGSQMKCRTLSAFTIGCTRANTHTLGAVLPLRRSARGEIHRLVHSSRVGPREEDCSRTLARVSE